LRQRDQSGDPEDDYAWAREQLEKYSLSKICPVLFSWVSPLKPEQQDKSLKSVPAGQKPISRLELVEKIIADALPVREHEHPARVQEQGLDPLEEAGAQR